MGQIINYTFFAEGNAFHETQNIVQISLKCKLMKLAKIRALNNCKNSAGKTKFSLFHHEKFLFILMHLDLHSAFLDLSSICPRFVITQIEERQLSQNNINN